jgi:hypothetical protein
MNSEMAARVVPDYLAGGVDVGCDGSYRSRKIDGRENGGVERVGYDLAEAIRASKEK